MSQFWDVVCPYMYGSTFTYVSLSIAIAIVVIVITHWYMKMDKCSTIFTVSAVPIIVVIAMVLVDSCCIVPITKTAFRHSFQTETVACLVQRPDLSSELKDILKPESHSGGYYLLEGPHGCGKTTILKNTIAECGSGILYVPFKAHHKHASDSLYSAMKLLDSCESNWVAIRSHVPPGICQMESSAHFKYTLKILYQAAGEIFSEDKYPPTVVFDNMAQILQYPDGIQTIDILQDFAKDTSDEKVLNFVFASSGSSVPNIMRSRSSKSRLHEIITVGDITDEEAVNYLSCMCPNATKDVITNAVRLVGGRFNDLVVAAHYIQKGKANKLENGLLTSIRADIISLPSRIATVLDEVVRRVLQSPRNTITRDAYNILVNKLNTSDLKAIEKTNVLWIDEKVVTFGSRLAQHYWQGILSNSTTGKLK